jgi:opine dehydrogenase
MTIAILGAVHGGSACAADLALNGFDVTLCSAYAPSHIQPILEKGGLEYSGKFGEGFIRIRATTNLIEAVKEADMIFIVTPSSIHENYARLLAPIFEKKRNKEQIILLNGSTTGGALFEEPRVKVVEQDPLSIIWVGNH